MTDTSALAGKLTRKSRRRSSTADRRLRIAGLVALAVLFSGPSLTVTSAVDELGALSDVHVRVRRHCPSCQLSATAVHRQHHKSVASSSPAAAAGESARLESIKRQILIKLGLNAKPLLPADAVPPRDVIMETLLRAEESASALGQRTTEPSPTPGRRAQQHQHPASDADSSAIEDDFYGKTSEIIAFAEPGASFLLTNFKLELGTFEKGKKRRPFSSESL